MPRAHGLAGYYTWAGRPESNRSVYNRALRSAVRVIHRESREPYGSPSIWDALIKGGHGVGENRIARLMRVEEVRAKTVKKWRALAKNCFGTGPTSVPKSSPFGPSQIGGGAYEVKLCISQVPSYLVNPHGET